MKKIALFFLLLPGFAMPSYAQREQDSLALVALYSSTDGSNWVNDTNWLSNKPIDKWHGVTIFNNRVTSLNLNNNNLTGTIPSEIGLLSSLDYILNLDGNNLTGSIPKEIGNLTNLCNLTLVANKLTGSIPIEIGNLTKLKNLSLSMNKLSGAIPKEIGNLTNLEELYSYQNELSSSIPNEVGNLIKLIDLVLTQNQLTGDIPKEIGNLTNLKFLELANNKLTGTVPSEIWNLKQLINLSLFDNQLTGNIPKEIGNLTNIETFQIELNKFNGSLPQEINNLTKLKMFYIDGNQFTGTVPSGIWKFKDLDWLSLGSNKLTGSIPKDVGALVNLRVFNLSGNNFSGSIPQEIGNLIKLEWFNVDNNNITGVIPKEIGNLLKLNLLSLCNNQISGSIPKEIGNLNNLSVLYLFKNTLSGDLPVEINNLTRLTWLCLEGNKLTGLPPLTLSQLESLRIEDNCFTFDDIEPNINLQVSYSYIYVPQDSIGKKQTVNQRIGKDYTFSVTCGGTHNQYQWLKDGSAIPSATASSYKISKLKQSDAGSYVCNVTNTVVTDLTISSRPINLNVTLNGRAKDSLALVTLYNSTSGAGWTNNTNWLSSEPISSWYGVSVGTNTGSKGALNDTSSVVSLDLSGNNLTGEIPSAIGDMVAMQSLKLDNNDLSGAVPAEINNITSLQTLELSSNKLEDLPPLTLTLLDNLIIDNNQFSFEDIVPNLSAASKDFTYYSQDSIGIRKDTICNVGGNIRFIASDSATDNIYQWYRDGASIPQANGNTCLKTNLNQSDAGLYTCTITNPSVPGLTIYQRPVKLLVSTITEINNAEDPGIKIFPNPSSGIVYIESVAGLPAGSRIEVCDMSGRVVLQKDREENKRQELNLSHLPKGVYLIKIHCSTRSYLYRVVIN